MYRHVKPSKQNTRPKPIKLPSPRYREDHPEIKRNDMLDIMIDCLKSEIQNNSTSEDLHEDDQGCNSIDIFVGPESGPEPGLSYVWSYLAQVMFGVLRHV